MALTTDTLFVGPTRPTMVGGVTYPAFIANAMITACIFLGANNIFYLFVCFPIHGVFYLICQKDPRMFELINLWSKTKGRNLNRRLWNSSSYSPLEKFREPADKNAAKLEKKKRK